MQEWLDKGKAKAPEDEYDDEMKAAIEESRKEHETHQRDEPEFRPTPGAPSSGVNPTPERRMERVEVPKVELSGHFQNSFQRLEVLGIVLL